MFFTPKLTFQHYSSLYSAQTFERYPVLLNLLGRELLEYEKTHPELNKIQTYWGGVTVSKIDIGNLGISLAPSDRFQIVKYSPDVTMILNKVDLGRGDEIYMFKILYSESQRAAIRNILDQLYVLEVEIPEDVGCFTFRGRCVSPQLGQYWGKVDLLNKAKKIYRVGGSLLDISSIKLNKRKPKFGLFDVYKLSLLETQGKLPIFIEEMWGEEFRCTTEGCADYAEAYDFNDIIIQKVSIMDVTPEYVVDLGFVMQKDGGITSNILPLWHIEVEVEGVSYKRGVRAIISIYLPLL